MEIKLNVVCQKNESCAEEISCMKAVIRRKKDESFSRWWISHIASHKTSGIIKASCASSNDDVFECCQAMSSRSMVRQRCNWFLMNKLVTLQDDDVKIVLSFASIILDWRVLAQKAISRLFHLYRFSSSSYLTSAASRRVEWLGTGEYAKQRSSDKALWK